MTVVTHESVMPLTGQTVQSIAAALCVDNVGLFAHSSMDASILNSGVVHRAFLCDPVVLPSWSPGRGFFSPTFDDIDCRIKIVHASMAYDDAETPIPDYISPDTFSRESELLTIVNVGHTDILDDAWADVGTRLIPWVSGTTAQSSSYDTWSRSNAQEERNPKRRAEYRREIASLASDFFSIAGGAIVNVIE